MKLLKFLQMLEKNTMQIQYSFNFKSQIDDLHIIYPFYNNGKKSLRTKLIMEDLTLST